MNERELSEERRRENKTLRNIVIELQEQLDQERKRKEKTMSELKNGRKQRDSSKEQSDSYEEIKRKYGFLQQELARSDSYEEIKRKYGFLQEELARSGSYDSYEEIKRKYGFLQEELARKGKREEKTMSELKNDRKQKDSSEEQSDNYEEIKKRRKQVVFQRKTLNKKSGTPEKTRNKSFKKLPHSQLVNPTSSSFNKMNPSEIGHYCCSCKRHYTCSNYSFNQKCTLK